MTSAFASALHPDTAGMIAQTLELVCWAPRRGIQGEEWLLQAAGDCECWTMHHKHQHDQCLAVPH